MEVGQLTKQQINRLGNGYYLDFSEVGDQTSWKITKLSCLAQIFRWIGGFFANTQLKVVTARLVREGNLPEALREKMFDIFDRSYPSDANPFQAQNQEVLAEENLLQCNEEMVQFMQRMKEFNQLLEIKELEIEQKIKNLGAIEIAPQGFAQPALAPLVDVALQRPLDIPNEQLVGDELTIDLGDKKSVVYAETEDLEVFLANSKAPVVLMDQRYYYDSDKWHLREGYPGQLLDMEYKGLTVAGHVPPWIEDAEGLNWAVQELNFTQLERESGITCCVPRAHFNKEDIFQSIKNLAQVFLHTFLKVEIEPVKFLVKSLEIVIPVSEIISEEYPFEIAIGTIVRFFKHEGAIFFKKNGKDLEVKITLVFEKEDVLARDAFHKIQKMNVQAKEIEEFIPKHDEEPIELEPVGEIMQAPIEAVAPAPVIDREVPAHAMNALRFLQLSRMPNPIEHFKRMRRMGDRHENI